MGPLYHCNEDDIILKNKLNQFFADTCMKQDYTDSFQADKNRNLKVGETNTSITKEEEIFRNEFERLREFERLEEAFQGVVPLKSEKEYVESSLCGDVINMTTDPKQTTEEQFYPRTAMTPITEESASSIEDVKSESRKPKDDSCRLFKPSKAIGGGDINNVIHKSPLKK